MPSVTWGMQRLGPQIVRTPEQEDEITARNAAMIERVRNDTWTGERYVQGRPMIEVARDVRADLAAAVRAGTIPDAGYVVSASRRIYDHEIKISTTAYRSRSENPEIGRYDRDLTEKIADLCRPYNCSVGGTDSDLDWRGITFRFNDALTP